MKKLVDIEISIDEKSKQLKCELESNYINDEDFEQELVMLCKRIIEVYVRKHSNNFKKKKRK